MWGRTGGPWWTNACIYPEHGVPMPSAARGRVCPKTGGATGRRWAWPWRCWSRLGYGVASARAGPQGTMPSGCLRRSGTVWPLEPVWSKPAYQGFGRPRQPRLRSGQRRTIAERSSALPEESWREIRVAEGSQGPRTYRFGAQWVRETRDWKPGAVAWAIYRQNWDGSEPAVLSVHCSLGDSGPCGRNTVAH